MVVNLLPQVLVGALVAIQIVSARVDIQKRIQPDAVKSPALPPLKPLPWGDVNFLHTTDTHGIVYNSFMFNLETNPKVRLA
jgi:2',3'-cyclic-nucleotide 2'-phosphodiesterase (5'-nucleotidase family)